VTAAERRIRKMLIAASAVRIARRKRRAS